MKMQDLMILQTRKRLRDISKKNTRGSFWKRWENSGFDCCQIKEFVLLEEYQRGYWCQIVMHCNTWFLNVWSHGICPVLKMKEIVMSWPTHVTSNEKICFLERCVGLLNKTTGTCRILGFIFGEASPQVWWGTVVQNPQVLLRGAFCATHLPLFSCLLWGDWTESRGRGNVPRCPRRIMPVRESDPRCHVTLSLAPSIFHF